MITLQIEASKSIQTFQIVGVDEANISKGKVSFISPIAKVLINKKIGDKVILKQAMKDIVFEVIDISYGL
jgi:transcription elongation factor GreB